VALPRPQADLRALRRRDLLARHEHEPDAPTSALLETNLWARTEPGRIDGVIFVDVQVLQYSWMRPAGAREGIDFALTSRNVVPFLANEVYFKYQDQAARKDYVGIVSQEVFQTFLAKASGQEALKAIIRAGADGHIVLNSTDPAVQRSFVLANVSAPSRRRRAATCSPRS